MITAFIHGIILAFGLILPLGVQNVFVFNQGAAQRRFIKALPVVVAASLCDTLLLLLAVFGLSVLVLDSYWFRTVLMGAGVLFLLYMGYVTWRSKPAAESGSAESLSPLKLTMFAVSVSLFNPHAVMDTVGVIGTSSLRYTGIDKAAFTAACILVSWLWFAGLALAGRITGRMDKSGRFMQVLNKVSAAIMWGTAVYLGLSLA